ncbi:MAG: histidine phosphatase family protein [Burkholderiaceae bacterium]|nr:histidine phosphatase family protein [Microbacteriaceae bacterium]
MRLLLVRHGQTPANVAGRLDTDTPGPGLTLLGLRQAVGLAEALGGTRVDAIATSRLIRTQLTAAPLLLDREFEPDVHPGLHEIEAGALEGDTDRDSIRQYLDTVFAWAAGDRAVRMPGGPDGHEFFGRFDADIAALTAADVVSPADPDRTVVVVSHGAAIRTWVAGRATNVSATFAADHELGNTGIVTLDGSDADGWSLLDWAGMPIGGDDLDDPTAHDPTGETLSEAHRA